MSSKHLSKPMPPTKPEVGGTYQVYHSRKGHFCMKVTAINGEWIEGIITSGTAKAIMSYNVREEGEEITIRDSFSCFTLIPA